METILWNTLFLFIPILSFFFIVIIGDELLRIKRQERDYNKKMAEDCEKWARQKIETRKFADGLTKRYLAELKEKNV